MNNNRFWSNVKNLLKQHEKKPRNNQTATVSCVSTQLAFTRFQNLYRFTEVEIFC